MQLGVGKAGSTTARKKLNVSNIRKSYYFLFSHASGTGRIQIFIDFSLTAIASPFTLPDWKITQFPSAVH